MQGGRAPKTHQTNNRRHYEAWDDTRYSAALTSTRVVFFSIISLSCFIFTRFNNRVPYFPYEIRSQTFAETANLWQTIMNWTEGRHFPVFRHRYHPKSYLSSSFFFHNQFFFHNDQRPRRIDNLSNIVRCVQPDAVLKHESPRSF